MGQLGQHKFPDHGDSVPDFAKGSSLARVQGKGLEASGFQYQEMRGTWSMWVPEITKQPHSLHLPGENKKK